MTTQDRPLKGAWGITALLFLFMLINFADKVVVGLAGPPLKRDLGLTDTATPRERLPIPVPTGDPSFDPSGTGAMAISMSRSNWDRSTGTSTDNPRQQINSITSYIDGSNVYGSDATRAAALREFVGGRLRTSAGNLMPFNTAGLANANDSHVVPDSQLFLAGDVRANENPELVALQTLFVREHNRIAAEAAANNPGWTDEQLYQHARRLGVLRYPGRSGATAHRPRRNLSLHQRMPPEDPLGLHGGHLPDDYDGRRHLRHRDPDLLTRHAQPVAASELRAPVKRGNDMNRILKKSEMVSESVRGWTVNPRPSGGEKCTRTSRPKWSSFLRRISGRPSHTPFWPFLPG